MAPGSRLFLVQASRALCERPMFCVQLQYGLPPPGQRDHVPHTITFQRKRANRQVINEDQMVRMLQEFGEVRSERVAQEAGNLPDWHR